MPEPTARCRFYSKHANRCTGEAVDPAGEILICQRHLGFAMELLTASGFTITPPTTKEN